MRRVLGVQWLGHWLNLNDEQIQPRVRSGHEARPSRMVNALAEQANDEVHSRRAPPRGPIHPLTHPYRVPQRPRCREGEGPGMSGYTIEAVSRAMRTLDALAENQPATIAEIAQAVEAREATISRVLDTLVEHDMARPRRPDEALHSRPAPHHPRTPRPRIRRHHQRRHHRGGATRRPAPRRGHSERRRIEQCHRGGLAPAPWGRRVRASGHPDTLPRLSLRSGVPGQLRLAAHADQGRRPAQDGLPHLHGHVRLQPCKTAFNGNGPKG